MLSRSRWPRVIIHADMDAFFAAVEQRDRPELRGKPVLVGGSPEGRGVVAAASYEARAFGCRSAMPMKTAVRLCPKAVIVRPAFNRYRETSDQVMAVFREVTPLVEPLSVDEAFLDLAPALERGRDPVDVARWIRAEVRRRTELTVSCGVATSKSVAKIASDVNKPDGLTVVPPGDEQAFLAPLPVRALWGIGPKTAERLERAGVRTVAELAERPLPWLIERFGVRGEWFHRLAVGDDDRPISLHHERKSVSHEHTFAEDVAEIATLRDAVRDQASRVAERLRKAELRATTVQLKLRLADFTTFTRQRRLPVTTRDAEAIANAAMGLLEPECTPGRKFRLVGTGVSGLVGAETASQLGLFDALTDPNEPPAAGADGDTDEDSRPRPEELEEAVAALRDRYGDASVQWGAEDPAPSG